MLRVREKTNSWPSFVDVFSNLVIILIFLLIVFVFLWTTTNVFNKGNSGVKVAELRKVAAEQTEQITQLKESEEQAKELLLVARDKLLELDKNRENLESENSKLSKEQMEVVAAYEKKLYDLQSERERLSGIVGALSDEMGALKTKSETDSRELSEQAASLQRELENVNRALSSAEQQRSQKDAEYAALSERLNKALADKVSELNQLNKYQSQFFGAVRDALVGMGGVDVSSDRFVISSDILFPVGGFMISPEGKNQIRIIAGIIKNMETKIPANVNWVIRVDGHTDRLPVRKNAKLYKNNLDLSLLRAKEVSKELEKNGVGERRLVPAGFGADYPIVEGRTAKDLQKNRRIELRLTNP
ncbi:MAG: OmpA family protein [Rickettsiales bacterium]|jgi:chemotaxis protein MotB|nr:OmpA family protein [Rickettsiales bacterium]